MSEELAESFRIHTKSAHECGKLSQDSYNQLQQMPVDTLDELESAYTQYVDMLSNPEYYKVLERMVKGAEYLERTDLSKEKREKAEALYDQLSNELEQLKR